MIVLLGTIFVSVAGIFLSKQFFNLSSVSFHGMLLSVTLSGLNCFVLLGLLKWAFQRSDKAFYGVLFGGMLWKLLVLGATAFCIFNSSAFHFNATLISMAGFLFLFSMVGIYSWILKKS